MSDRRHNAEAPACASEKVPRTMKWWGWGTESQGFDPVGRPHLWPYARHHLDLDDQRPRRLPVDRRNLTLPPRVAVPAFLNDLETILPGDRRSDADQDRLLHAYGRSTRDLWRLRHGMVDFAPDLVVFPNSEDEIVALVRLAERHGVVLIPFGGGSNVAGCLEWPSRDGRMTVSVNLRLLNRVLEIDRAAGTARIQAGILGPDLERELGASGLTLGHFPDSFPYSTLGGWVATRSSGMMSDRYGNVEDMVVSLRMATPRGMVATRPVPHASNGPDSNRACIGSEGTLGIITELTMAVHRQPAVRAFRGYLFRDFATGIEALRETVRQGCRPTLSRLHDPKRTQLSAAFKPDGGAAERTLGPLIKWYLRRIKGFDLDQACLLVTGFDGDRVEVAQARRRAANVYRRFGAVDLGRSPGEAFAEGKFDFPYIRDFLMDYDVIVDVSETSISWGKMMPLYREGLEVLSRRLAHGGRKAWVGCHVSHTYHSGASLYFSFAFRCRSDGQGRIDPAAELAHYSAAKKATLDCFAALGATLSHHHAVGYEHLPWYMNENGMAGASATQAIKAVVDPHNIMNPGKLVATTVAS
ncbi:MAG: FAD-binding oxidoreductase [Alphaproteobacteria bacterium]|nr:FAD-binding oxidoreductase [Alphaproteobacteria bacterium]